MKISTRVFLTLSLGYIIFAAVIIVLINFEMKQQALHEAESKASLLLNHNLAIHAYFSHQLKPKLFDWTKHFRSPDYFEPTWMSSTYAIREIEKYLIGLSAWKYYYKECAINARSPENEADPNEKAFLLDLAKDPKLTLRSAIREFDDQPYFVTLRRGESMEASCLRCHSTPELAPGGLVKTYGDQRSFHRQMGEVVQAISIRVPLAEAYAAANRFSLRLSILFLLALFCLYLGQVVVNRNWVFNPLKTINDQALAIVNSHVHLGETIPLPRGRELADLANAFNDMSLHLAQVYKSLEDRVKQRTLELYQLNVDLTQELAERQRVEAEISRRNRDVSLINSMSTLLQACQAQKDTFPVIAWFGRELFPETSGVVFIRDPERHLVEVATSWGDPLGPENLLVPEDCWVLSSGQPLLAGTGGHEVHCSHAPTLAPGGWRLCLPLKAQEDILGLLRLQSAGATPAPLTQQMQDLGKNVTDHLALALANIRLRESLRYQALHDPLTGLFNRRYLEETLEREIHRVRRKGASLGLIMLDLDHFKQFNDTYGHEAGDNLLRTLGNFLRTHVRKEDVACRFGGEEFVLILPESSQETTLKRAESIRRRVPALQVFHRGQVLEGVSVSLGVAMFPEHGYSGDDVLRAADDALYQAKTQGRNRVVLATENGEGDAPETSQEAPPHP